MQVPMESHVHPGDTVPVQWAQFSTLSGLLFREHPFGIPL